MIASTLAIFLARILGFMGFIMALIPLCWRITHRLKEGIGKEGSLASIVWSEQMPAAGTLVAVTILTVGISLFVHGITAKPFAQRLAAGNAP